MDRGLRRRLREELAAFDLVTVHSSSAKLPDGRVADIAAEDRAYREASIAHYLALAELAHDLGASLATFHARYQVPEETNEDVRRAHLDLARVAVERYASGGLILGFEYFDAELAEAIGNPGFGVLFDIGHAAMRSSGDLTAATLALIDGLAPFVVQYHVHGVHVGPDGRKVDHRPLSENNAIDYGRVMAAIAAQAFAGPLILEIEAWSGGEVWRNLEHARLAREELITLWQEA
jgi:sugar phosphate isomerase/epimerase